MRTAAVALLVASATILGQGDVQKLAAQVPDVRVLGTEVQLIQHNDVDLRGELLALQGESLWILDADEQFLEVPIVDIRQVRMQRHRLSSGRIWRWTLVAGGLTSAAMFGACTSYGESAGGCGLMTFAWGAAWAGIGAVSAQLITLPGAFSRVIERRCGHTRDFRAGPAGKIPCAGRDGGVVVTRTPEPLNFCETAGRSLPYPNCTSGAKKLAGMSFSQTRPR